MTNSFIVCAFYTKDTPYEEVCEEYLRPSLRELKIDYDIVGVDNLGNWSANTSFKPTFAKQMLSAHKRNILLLDVDCRVLKYPVIFDHVPEHYNFAAHILDHDSWYHNGSHRKELLTGTLFLRNNDRTKLLVDYWEAACSRTNEWEQRVLQRELAGQNEQVYNIPIWYCWINSLPNGNEPFVRCDDPIIVHYQSSRQYKKCLK